MKIDLYHLTNCPYCIHAANALDELREEDLAYAQVEVNWIEESTVTDFPAYADYYYVPTIYFGEEKLYEAQPGQDYDTIKANVKRALDKVLGRA